MFESIDYMNLLYIDIETAGIEKHYFDTSQQIKDAWEYHCDRNNLIVESSEVGYESAWQDHVALIPEFSQIVAVSIGYYYPIDDNYSFKTQTYHQEEMSEKLLLGEVKRFLDNRKQNIIAHAGKDFDYPFLIRRMLINDMLPPMMLRILNKKPWEIKLLDTKEIWKFGGYRSASLATLCAAFDIPSPKEDMTGKDVHLFFHAGRIKDIAKYCSNDVRALAMFVQSICLTEIEETKIQIDYV